MDDTEFVHWEIIFLWGFISVHAILGVNGPGQPLALPPPVWYYWSPALSPGLQAHPRIPSALPGLLEKSSSPGGENLKKRGGDCELMK